MNEGSFRGSAISILYRGRYLFKGQESNSRNQFLQILQLELDYYEYLDSDTPKLLLKLLYIIRICRVFKSLNSLNI